MLVLSRKQGESIQLGNNVTITVSTISKGRVKICIQAPQSCPIRRTETIRVDEYEALPTPELVTRAG